MANLKKSIKKKLLDSENGKLLFYRIRFLREWWALTSMNDYAYIKKEYKKRLGKDIYLKNPKTFTEKLQWLKLFYRNDNMPICSDKYDIRLYLEKIGYQHLLNEVIGVYESPEEIDNIDLDTLPKSFVVKATHGSSWNLVCNDKNKLNWNLQKAIFKKWLKLNIFVFGREWNYQSLKPRIIIEKMIDYRPLIDYKIACFNGEPRYFQVNFVKGDKRFIDIYDLSWNKLPIGQGNYIISEEILPPPPALDKLLELAKVLSKDFPFVRVDFYNFEDTIILGELTFFPGGGLNPFYPETEKNENLYGSYLTLPEPNHNFELYKKINA